MFFNLSIALSRQSITAMTEPIYFRKPDDLHHWLIENHDTEPEFYIRTNGL